MTIHQVSQPINRVAFCPSLAKLYGNSFCCEWHLSPWEAESVIHLLIRKFNLQPGSISNENVARDCYIRSKLIKWEAGEGGRGRGVQVGSITWNWWMAPLDHPREKLNALVSCNQDKGLSQTPFSPCSRLQQLHVVVILTVHVMSLRLARQSSEHLSKGHTKTCRSIPGILAFCWLPY